MIAKYLCVSGFVFREDGDRHFINCHDLPRLYGVDPKECRFCNSIDMHGIRLEDYGEILHPDSTDKYELGKCR